LWSTMDEATPDGGEPMDANYGFADLAPETLERIKADCAAFQDQHGDDIRDDVERAGHDYWLTRNFHGCGFWDGDWPEGVGERLTAASHACGEVDLYVGDDGTLERRRDRRLDRCLQCGRRVRLWRWRYTELMGQLRIGVEESVLPRDLPAHDGIE